MNLQADRNRRNLDEEECNKVMRIWRNQHSSCTKDHREMQILDAKVLHRED